MTPYDALARLGRQPTAYDREYRQRRAMTVYPSIAGRFPPATFFETADALKYTREMQDNGASCGLMICPANSYETNYPETVRK